ncbi:MAG: type II toxin-antitoxin system PemK/MazF family toxin [Synergistaceae bacterium]|jgi:mRNA interferase MazF|nr:type II toxin-antitoxin system PemK/MazF family toxin [Synergistaceae bacterium]
MVNSWDIYFCSLDPTQGSEQRGTRPVLIVSNDSVNHSLPVSTVLPLSSIKPGSRVYPSEVLLPAALTGLPKDSVAMVQQVRTIAHTRLIKLSGQLADEALREEIREAIRVYFDV